jgi:hypothetical protein
MPPITRAGLFHARKIWIDVALGGAARRRRVALRQRCVAAFVIVGPPAVHMQANRISGIVRLGASRCRCQNRCDRENRQSRNAHSSRPKCLLHCVPRSGLGRIFRSQADRSLCSQSIHVRALGQPELRRDSACRRAGLAATYQPKPATVGQSFGPVALSSQYRVCSSVHPGTA